MSATATKCCEAKTFGHLTGLDGLSNEQMEYHFKLYNGYVTNTNTVMEKLQELVKAGKQGTPEWAELKRRLGFEVNGVVLHELYFNNMKPSGGDLPGGSKLAKMIEENFGSYDNFLADFKATGMMRGIGWVITYQCSQTGKLVNFWVTDHENGHPAGMNPVLVMDVWEHAYTVDFKPTDRKVYIDAFFKNVNWQEVESRLN
ncbi:MAG: superoxide dismutase [Vampirovibrio sp.]|nr:superoxide dismutase [Vampirovibrio sp.]